MAYFQTKSTKCKRGSEQGVSGRGNAIEVTVKSKNVAAWVEVVPYFSGVLLDPGPTMVLPRRKVIYNRLLDEDQERLVQSAKELAGRQGLKLRVHDLSTDSILLRFLRAVFRREAFTPALIIRGNAPSLLTTSGLAPVSRSSVLRK